MNDTILREMMKKTLEVAAAHDIGPEDFLIDLISAQLGYLYVMAGQQAQTPDELEIVKVSILDEIDRSAERAGDTFLAYKKKGMI